MCKHLASAIKCCQSNLHLPHTRTHTHEKQKDAGVSGVVGDEDEEGGAVENRAMTS